MVMILTICTYIDTENDSYYGYKNKTKKNVFAAAKVIVTQCVFRLNFLYGSCVCLAKLLYF